MSPAHGREWLGRVVQYLGRTWRVYDVMPSGSLVLRSPWWLPRWAPFGGIVITSQLDDEEAVMSVGRRYYRNADDHIDSLVAQLDALQGAARAVVSEMFYQMDGYTRQEGIERVRRSVRELEALLPAEKPVEGPG